jgi:hypothetical protein
LEGAVSLAYIERPAPRTGMAGWIGWLRARFTRADGSAVAASFYVPKPEAIECDFWLCTCRETGDNEDFYFGPVSRA